MPPWRSSSAMPLVQSTLFVSDTLTAPKPKGFAEINRRFLEANAALLGAEVVAMGDRAGSFAYDRIEILRPYLTSFPGPHLTVYRSEEIAHFDDIAIYDNRRDDEGDYRLYAWRLDCRRLP
jgi:hypothetical protein